MKNGFAIGIALLLLLVLTILGFTLLLTAGNYYATSRNYFAVRNAQVATEAVLKQMIDTHNQDEEARDFQFQKSFTWEGFDVSSTTGGPWSSLQANPVTVKANKGPVTAVHSAELRQMRLEDFALYSDADQTLVSPSLLDGLVFSRGSIQLGSTTRFRDLVQASIFPEWNASYRKRSFRQLDYPELDSLWTVEQWQAAPLCICDRNPLFWMGDHYELNLDDLILVQIEDRWSVEYRGIQVGIVDQLHFWFDGELQLQQTDSPLPLWLPEKASQPLYLAAPRIVLNTPIQFLDRANSIHPLCLISTGAVVISNHLPPAARVNALVLATGSEMKDGEEISLLIEPGSEGASGSVAAEIRHSAFVLEDAMRDLLESALTGGEKVIWFRGSVITKARIAAPPEAQLHFEASRNSHPLVPSLPFIQIVEGSQRWL